MKSECTLKLFTCKLLVQPNNKMAQTNMFQSKWNDSCALFDNVPQMEIKCRGDGWMCCNGFAFWLSVPIDDVSFIKTILIVPEQDTILYCFCELDHSLLNSTWSLGLKQCERNHFMVKFMKIDDTCFNNLRLYYVLLVMGKMSNLPRGDMKPINQVKNTIAVSFEH